MTKSTSIIFILMFALVLRLEHWVSNKMYPSVVCVHVEFKNLVGGIKQPSSAPPPQKMMSLTHSLLCWDRLIACDKFGRILLCLYQILRYFFRYFS